MIGSDGLSSCYTCENSKSPEGVCYWLAKNENMDLGRLKLLFITIIFDLGVTSA